MARLRVYCCFDVDGKFSLTGCRSTEFKTNTCKTKNGTKAIRPMISNERDVCLAMAKAVPAMSVFLAGRLYMKCFLRLPSGGGIHV